MSEELVKYADLSADAKQHARDGFIHYYVRGFKGDDLEVVSSLADDRDMSMINHLLEENNFQTVDQLSQLAERMLPSSFDNIIESLDMKFNLNGEPEKTWVAWEQAIHAQLPVED